MSIALPDLDDRRWADLVEQGRALIPLHAPEWTDHNASDPGITLMELFAWVAEMDLYRVNRLTDDHKRRLLALMGIRPAPPAPATLVCALRIASGAGPVTLPAGSEFSGTRRDAAPVLLRSTAAMDVVDVELVAVQHRDAAGWHDDTAAWGRQQVFALFGDDPRPGVEVYLGFDRPLPAARWTQLHCGIEGADPGERARIVAEDGGGGPPVHHGVRLAWEYLAAGGEAATWRALDADDDTRAFTLDGALHLRPDRPMQAAALGRVVQPRHWVRCRLASGGFDAAPRATRLLSNALALVQSVPVWTSWPIAAGTVVPDAPTPGLAVALRLTLQRGQIVALARDTSPEAPAFVVLAYQAATATTPGALAIEGMLAGAGTGEPGQRVTLGRRPLVESTLRVVSDDGVRYRRWTQVDDFAASKRADAHFRLDPTRGTLVFGDGERGSVLAAGSTLFAFYEATEPAPAVATVAGLADSPRNRTFLPDPGAIGRIVAAGAPAVVEDATPAEPLAHAIGRAALAREARLRAVTVEDFEAIARETPGLRVARAVARANLYPGFDCISAPGIVAVIVLPFLPVSRPLPGAGFIDRVAARLEARRTIGTRVVVVGPDYLNVAVRATLKAFDGTDPVRLAAAASAALDAFFDPLQGGPDGGGWPLGRDVYRAEVMQVLDETAGVDHVVALELVVQGCAPTCGNVCLRPTWLVDAGPHAIEVR